MRAIAGLVGELFLGLSTIIGGTILIGIAVLIIFTVGETVYESVADWWERRHSDKKDPAPNSQ